MSDPVIRTHELEVRYGDKVALDGASLEVERGSLYALLGRNGAGKSSLIRCLLGHLKASAGEIEVLGLEPWTQRDLLMDRVGVVAEKPDLPSGMAIGKVGRFCASVEPSFSLTQFEQRLARRGLALDASIDQLSRGQQTQVQLALALAGEPELLVLDDPTLGLDAVARQEVFGELIDELAEREVTVLVTTHDLAGIEALATHVGFLRQGELVLSEAVEALKGRVRRIGSVAPGTTVAGETLRRRATPLGEELVVATADPQLGEAMNLEEIFVALVGDEDAAAVSSADAARGAA